MCACPSAREYQTCRPVFATMLLLSAAISWTSPTAAASRPATATSTTAPRHADARKPDTSPSAEVQFAAPTYFAVVVEPHTLRRRLYGAGDLIGDAPGVAHGAVVDGVEAAAVRLRDPRHPQIRRVTVGEAIPGMGGRRLAAIVMLEAVEYRYVTTSNTPDPEPRIRQIRDRRAWLDMDVTPPATKAAVAPPGSVPRARATEYTLQTQQRLDGPLLERVRVEPTGPNTYALNAADVQWALEHAGQVLQEAWGAVRPLVSFQEGLRFRIESPLADGVLGAGGFQVHSPKLAERAGLMAGDIVRSVNGRPVNGFPDLFRLYQEVKRNPQLSAVEVSLERQGQLLTKTYRIR